MSIDRIHSKIICFDSLHYSLCFLLLVLCLPIAEAHAAEPSRLVFVRHGQTFSNAGGTPSTSDGDIHSLNELGQQQAEALVKDLKPYSFTAIAVSPMDRAIATLIPYLRASAQRAEVWPELAECCYQKEREAPPTGVVPQRLFVAPDFARDVLLIPLENGPHWLQCDTYQDGLTQIAMAAERIDAYLQKPGCTLLVGGHSLHGSRLIEKLAGPNAAEIHLENGKVTILRRETDGHYVLEMRNGIRLPR